MGWGWNPSDTGEEFDLDASAFMLGANKEQSTNNLCTSPLKYGVIKVAAKLTPDQIDICIIII